MPVDEDTPKTTEPLENTKLAHLSMTACAAKAGWQVKHLCAAC
jgi:hypothetical protein